MAERKRGGLPRSASCESADLPSDKMGKPRERKLKKPKERWLLTRKTWRYMADAGKKLIPEGVHNRPEDIPKIEAYFQELCKKETKFLLWRKNSYPGAVNFRKKRKDWRKGGSCRKASSADEFEIFKPDRPSHLPIGPSTSRFDIRKMKEDFMNKPYSPPDTESTVSSYESPEEKQLISMLENYLKITDKERPSSSNSDLNYQELVDKLQRHLTQMTRTLPNYSTPPQGRTYHMVHFEGDHVQKSLSETLSRYFSAYPNRDKVISDLLTDRRALEKLYFDLRKAKGFRGRPRGNTQSWRVGFSESQRNSPNFERRFGSPLPVIEIEDNIKNFGTQTLPIPETVLLKVEEEYKKAISEKEEEERENKPSYRRKSSVDHDDVSQSVSDTIKRYLRMARKKSVDTDKADRFKRVNYDRNLRNIKAKGEITKPGDDDGLNKGCQTNDDWILTYRDLKFNEISDTNNHVDASVDDFNKSSPSSPPSILSSSQSFLSHLIHGGKHGHDKTDKNSSAIATGAMQKSKSSSSVMHHGSRLVAKKIFRSRSKSQVRSNAPSSWTPQGGCIWTDVTGRQVVLGDTNLLHLTEIERQVIQKVALAKLQALNLGVSVKIPTDSVGATTSKPKRRPYLLKRKALTTSIFDTSRKDSEKDGIGGLVFGIPLTQCVENDRLSRVAAGVPPFRNRNALSGSADENSVMQRHGSRASFSSLSEPQRGDESDSCDSTLSQKRITGSVPGLLDTISCGSTTDIAADVEEESLVPNIINECIRHLEGNGLRTLGIFRVSTSKKRIRQLREDFDCGKETSLDNQQCPHDVATLLKEYLRDLPDPLLCRELYQAFVQTQKVRNRRLQFEALQHLVQLLPPANRDTLWVLLNFLSLVAKYSTDSTDSNGEAVPGNKMDSNNLATVFAPNILHCIKPGSSRDTSGDRPEDRLDVINVVRTLIDHYQQMFSVPAELLDEVYVHLMDTHPEALDQLLNKRDAIATADESVDELDSESNSAPWTPTKLTSDVPLEHVFHGTPTESSPSEPRKTYSREEFLHEAAATGGPNVAMRVRHKDRIRERVSKKRREDSLSRRRTREDDNTYNVVPATKTIMAKIRSPRDEDYTKLRSSSLESTSSIQNDSEISRVLRANEESQGIDRRKSSPYVLDNSGVITASLTIPVQSAYNLEDDIPFIEESHNVRAPSATRRRHRSGSGSDSSGISNILQPLAGSISLNQQNYDSAIGSSATFSSLVQNTSSSVASSIADASVHSSPPSWASTPPTTPDSTHTTANYIPDDTRLSSKTILQKGSKESSPTLQKVSFVSAPEVQQVRQVKQKETPKVSEYKRSVGLGESVQQERERNFTPSITNIGNAVLRSKTADFERIAKTDVKIKQPTQSSSVSDKKKYTKRRYTDSRHQTRHIPDSEALEAASGGQTKKESPAGSSQAGPVYKRRELISSVPSK